MTDLYDRDNECVICNLEEDSIDALPQAEALLSREFLRACRPRVICQAVDSSENTGYILFWYSTYVLGNRFLEDDPISGHAP